MTKAEIINELALEMKIDVREAKEIVQTILDKMADSLSRGGGIELRGFGSFIVKEYPPYIGRNPKSGEAITVKPKKLPVFRVGKELREAVDENRKG